MTLACLGRGRLREVHVDLFHTPRRQRAAERGRRVARNHLEVLQPLHRRLRQDQASAVAPQLKRNPAGLWLGRRLQHDPIARPRAHLNLHRGSGTRPRRRLGGGGGGCGGGVGRGGVGCSGHGREAPHCCRREAAAKFDPVRPREECAHRVRTRAHHR
eukprot:scaffold57658_cov60-Phaeocystis_antarctica.AAC.2